MQNSPNQDIYNGAERKKKKDKKKEGERKKGREGGREGKKKTRKILLAQFWIPSFHFPPLIRLVS